MPPRPNKPHTNKTRTAIAEVTAHLKAQYKQQQAYKQEQTTRQLMRPSHTTPTASRASRNTYGANTFKQCPGGARDEARTGAYAAYLKQVNHPETGCIAIDPNTESHTERTLLGRLTRSARNANTTQGNYGYSKVH